MPRTSPLKTLLSLLLGPGPLLALGVAIGLILLRQITVSVEARSVAGHTVRPPDVRVSAVITSSQADRDR